MDASRMREIKALADAQGDEEGLVASEIILSGHGIDGGDPGYLDWAEDQASRYLDEAPFERNDAELDRLSEELDF